MRKSKVLLAAICLGLVAGSLLPATALAGFGIDPGKVYIDNLSPGARAEVPITLYNQNTYETTFTIGARDPDYTAPDYEHMPYLDWIAAQPSRVTIPPGEKASVVVTIVMPDNARYSGKMGEAWVSFREETTEMVKVEVCSRPFISTRPPVSATQVPMVKTEGSLGISAEPRPPESIAAAFPGMMPAAAIVVLALGGLGFILLWRKKI